MKEKYSEGIISELVKNDLHTTPESLQEEAIEKLTERSAELTELKIKQILRMIKTKYEQSKIETGSPVGVVAAQSIGEPGTQMTLRTFHIVTKVGFVTGGLDRIVEIVNATKNIKNPTMQVEISNGANVKLLLEKIGDLKNIRTAEVSPEHDRNIIYTRGSNLSGVLSIEGIDKQRTITNDIREIEFVLGIEAARDSIIQQLHDIYTTEGLEIDIRHIILIADMMTVNGVVEAIGRAGVINHKSSVIARMAYEETMGILYEAGWLSNEDKLNGISENVIIGKVINVGTGRSGISLEYIGNK